MTEVTASEPPADTLVEGSSGRPLAVPDSLHSQLFLLAYDRYRRRVDGYQRWRVLGVARTTRVLLRDDRMVSRLADRVAATLRDGIAGRPTDERLLAIGLIGALGELPTVFDFEVATRHYHELDELVHQAIPPICGMRDVIVAVHSRMRAIENGPWST